MKKSIIILLFFFLSCSSQLSIPQPVNEPVEASAYEDSKIREGIDLHDKGFFKEAVACYSEVLQINPSNIVAIYEMSYSYFQMGDQENSLKYSMQGMRYNSTLLSQFYMNAGNSLDILGKPRQAIEIYRKAIILDPGQNMFYYNMAIAYLRLEEAQQAETYFIESLKRNHNHASSHYALADIFFSRGEQIPAILLLCKFLIIEPNSQRSLLALEQLEKVLAAGVSREGEKNITINIFGLADSSRGHFSSVEMFYKLSRASRYAESGKDAGELELRKGDLGILLSFLEKEKLRNKDPFMEKYLISYFSDLSKAGLLDAFFYYIHQSCDEAEVREWLRQNWPDIEKFEQWKEAYRLDI